MSFNPYEILNNIRRNSNKEPLKAFELQKSDNNLSVSYTNAHPYKPQPNFQNEPAKSKDNVHHFSNSNGFVQPPKNEMSNFTTVTTISTNRNTISDMRDKENNYNPDAAIRLYKNKLMQEMPELVTKDPYDQDNSTLIHDRSSQNLSLNDLGGHYENKSIEKLQTEFNQLKRDLKTELHNLQSRRDTEPFTKEEVRKSSRSQDNKYSRNTGLFTFKNQQEFKSSKKMGTGSFLQQQQQQQGTGPNKEKITGALKLQPFIYLRENYPEFPQSIIKIDLKELKNL